MIDYLLAAVVVLQILDAYTTYTILGNGGIELNGLLRPLFEKVGVLPVMVIKGAALIALAYYFGPPAQIALCVVYVLVVANNLKVIYK